MVKQRKVACVKPDGRVESVTRPIPELKDGEVLVKVHASLISPGTEMNLVRTRRETPDKAGSEICFGYSSAGEIVAIKGDPKGLEIGMAVAGMGGGACHGSYNVIPVNLVVPIPAGVSYEEATFASLAATSLQAVRRTEPALGEYGMVLGLGIVGNLAAQLYQLSGARVLGWESLRNRAAIGRKCGIADTIDFTKVDAVAASRAFAAPYGMDFALLAFGGNAEKAFMAVKQAMKVSADGHAMGRVVVVGGCRFPFDGGAWSGNLDVRCSSRTGAGYHDPDWEHGKDYPAAFVQFTSRRNARELLQLIAEKKLKVKPLITHRLKLNAVGEAADMLLEHPDAALGIILEME